MTTAAAAHAPSRAAHRAPGGPLASGLPDPRPLTGYSVEYAEPDGRSVLYVTLEQPCLIGEPTWTVIDSSTGETKTLPGKAEGDGTSSTVIVFTHDSILDKTFNFIAAPYQDPEVRNFGGGFVSPAPVWFRSPG
jgi:hypothetical protein